MSYSLGIDIGSTTVKTVLIDENKKILYKSYERHFTKPREVLLTQLDRLSALVDMQELCVAVTGSAGVTIARQCAAAFVQEVFATAALVQSDYPETSAVIELGGEDAKIIFLEGTVEERMNSTCAGGTGAFIDQMAVLLNVTTEQLDALSLCADTVYPIASRCGVFAKTDIQPLINQGVKKENLAASIYQAVVDQTISGLAQGRSIHGRVLFLGGPLTFLKGLQRAFCSTLEGVVPVFPEYGEFFVAFGASFYAAEAGTLHRLPELIAKLRSYTVTASESSLPPLFDSHRQYDDFVRRHSEASVLLSDCGDCGGTAYLGVDAGSTTTKTVLMGSNGSLLYTDYRSNRGAPLDIVRAQLTEIYSRFPSLTIGCSAVTGYGEELIKNAFHMDMGVVETVAHYTAAQHFLPEVDFIIDIGGQDMKCFGIADGAVDSVIINEACSSGCGSFIETFAVSLGYTTRQFARLAVEAEHPVDLGSRCTVFMNSSVKEAQNNGAQTGDIAAGLAISVVSNALNKVLRVADASSLGKRIVVQGGTFMNDAVLRAFERQLGAQVTRPSIAGLMGAYGAALIAREHDGGQSTILDATRLTEFRHHSRSITCGLCANHCPLTVNEFAPGEKYISGNRCQRPNGHKAETELPNLYAFKQRYFERFRVNKGTGGVIGIPMVLNFYDTLPFWFTVFSELGYSVAVSAPSSRATYRRGQHTIPSDTVCYGAKLVHGHVLELAGQGVDAIFYPRMSYNYDEGGSDNHYHCPVVAYYPEVIANSLHDMGDTKLLIPYLALNDLHLLSHQLAEALRPLTPDITDAQVRQACKRAVVEQRRYRDAVLAQGQAALDYAAGNNLKTVVLAGRPYHVDPEINHGIDRLASELGFVLLSEDALPRESIKRHTDVLNQWSYHDRMYNAAAAVGRLDSTELVQLVSFGCGLDAVTTDEVKSILRDSGKLYTAIKIDEINNLGAVRIRLRSLLAAMEQKEARAGVR